MNNQTIVWNKVEESLPEETEYVLITVNGYAGKEVFSGYIDSGIWHWENGCEIDEDVPVTHWAKLPDPAQD